MKKLVGVTCVSVILVVTIGFSQDRIEAHASSKIIATNDVESGLSIPKPLQVGRQRSTDSTDKHIEDGSFRHLLADKKNKRRFVLIAVSLFFLLRTIWGGRENQRG